MNAPCPLTASIKRTGGQCLFAQPRGSGAGIHDVMVMGLHVKPHHRDAGDETDPEIVGPVIIRHAADLPEGLSPHMKPLIEWHFAGED